MCAYVCSSRVHSSTQTTLVTFMGTRFDSALGLRCSFRTSVRDVFSESLAECEVKISGISAEEKNNIHQLNNANKLSAVRLVCAKILRDLICLPALVKYVAFRIKSV